jgi:DMSO/TMAO reductase YedYZ molybdopterin-dependent catalytic subunit
MLLSHDVPSTTSVERLTGQLSPAAKVTRRTMLRVAAQFGPGLLAANRRAHSASLHRMVRFPEKRELILQTDRPPQLETPLHYFRQDLTPNEAFFVRWHLAGIPTSVDTGSFRLQVDGHVRRSLVLSLEDLRRRFEPVSIVAVAQCSGNSRSLFAPRVPGAQWKHGAMGNALWTGVRLRDLLDAAGIRAAAIDVSFDGLDEPPLASIPDMVKSLAVDRAREPDVIVAWEMNGQPLPVLNGFPLRLVVPGWYATYWIKALCRVTVLTRAFDGYWMAKAYRIPNNSGGAETPEHLAAETVPINRFTVRSLFVRPEPGERIAMGCPASWKDWPLTTERASAGWKSRWIAEGIGWMLASIPKSVSTRSAGGDTSGRRRCAERIGLWYVRRIMMAPDNRPITGTAAAICGALSRMFR